MASVSCDRDIIAFSDFCFKCRKANGKLRDDNEYIPMENIRHVEPGIKQPNVINLYPLDKYACAPESKL